MYFKVSCFTTAATECVTISLAHHNHRSSSWKISRFVHKLRIAHPTPYTHPEPKTPKTPKYFNNKKFKYMQLWMR